MPALLRAQKIAGSPDFKVAHRYLKPGAKFREFADCLQAFFRDFL